MELIIFLLAQLLILVGGFLLGGCVATRIALEEHQEEVANLCIGFHKQIVALQDKLLALRGGGNVTVPEEMEEL
jgi:hypothetical protein